MSLSDCLKLSSPPLSIFMLSLRTSLRTISLRTNLASFAACKVNVVHGYTRLILGSFRYVQAAVFYNLVDVTGGELTNKIIKIQ